MTLTPEQQAFVASQVAAGQFSTAKEVLDEALRLLELKENSDRKLDELRADIRIAIEQLDRGERIPFTAELAEQIKQEGMRRAALRRSSTV